MTRSKSCASKKVQGGAYMEQEYNTKEYYEKFDSMLKNIDEEYRTTVIDFSKYKTVMFAMAELMEMESAKQNRIALYLYNIIINIKLGVKLL